MSTEDTENWLASLGTTLWANWDVTDPERRRLAAEWFEDQLLSYEEWMIDNAEPTTAPNELPPPASDRDNDRFGWGPPAKGTHESGTA